MLVPIHSCRLEVQLTVSHGEYAPYKPVIQNLHGQPKTACLINWSHRQMYFNNHLHNYACIIRMKCTLFILSLVLQDLWRPPMIIRELFFEHL